MRKFMALVGVSGMMTMIPSTPALAQVIDTHGNNCEMIVPDASGNLTGAHVTGGTLFIRSNKTWTTMTCHFDLTDAETPPKTTHASGFACEIPPLPATTDTRATASASGQMVLTCRVKN
jgi:hypothetical protein